jgi:hypothetical protein
MANPVVSAIDDSHRPRWPYAFGIPGLTLLLSAALGLGVGSWAMSLIAGAAAIRVANSLPPLLGSPKSTA